MGRKPKGKINTLFRRFEGLKNKAEALGNSCNCQVAFIVIPPNGCNNDEVIDLSVNGSVMEIVQKYATIQQQHPGREQSIYIPDSKNLVSQQPGVPNVERNDYELPSSVDPYIRQTIPGGMDQTYYAPPLAHGVQPVVTSPNAHVGSNEQVSMPQQMQRCAEHCRMYGMYGMPQEYYGMVRHCGNHIPQQYINRVPMQQGNVIPQQQGHEAIYRSFQLHQENVRSSNTLLRNEMQASAVQHSEAPLIPDSYFQHSEAPLIPDSYFQHNEAPPIPDLDFQHSEAPPIPDWDPDLDFQHNEAPPIPDLDFQHSEAPGMAGAPPSGYSPYIPPPLPDRHDSPATIMDETQFLP
ncbi:hypothetical protein KC19_1G028700 [Ceratodon purpureus]|uniref:MADS-box domain-containing protein n=1 Tax=Ceratodon purpureus TaxID=3225 RepID=A0A8T0J2V5_CERPU|nr:hypothetical protein KC19_1G028700 [Ceratodon purpureus]